MTVNGHGFRIKEVGVEEIPPLNAPLRISKWASLFEDVSLRLEQTSYQFALAIEGFAEKKIARSAANAMSNMSRKKFGVYAVRCEVRENGKGWVLYIRRGKNWKK